MANDSMAMPIQKIYPEQIRLEELFRVDYRADDAEKYSRSTGYQRESLYDDQPRPKAIQIDSSVILPRQLIEFLGRDILRRSILA